MALCRKTAFSMTSSPSMTVPTNQPAPARGTVEVTVTLRKRPAPARGTVEVMRCTPVWLGMRSGSGVSPWQSSGRKAGQAPVRGGNRGASPGALPQPQGRRTDGQVDQHSRSSELHSPPTSGAGVCHSSYIVTWNFIHVRELRFESCSASILASCPCTSWDSRC